MEFIRKYQILTIILAACLLAAGHVLSYPYFSGLDQYLKLIVSCAAVTLPLLNLMQGRKLAIVHSLSFAVLFAFPVSIIFTSGLYNFLSVFLVILICVSSAFLYKEKTAIAYLLAAAPVTISIVAFLGWVVSWKIMYS